MFIFVIIAAFIILDYANRIYEPYDPEKIKKKRVFVKKPLYFNIANIITFSIVLIIFFLLQDYCSNNFGIDLKEAYAEYNEKDLLFGKMNICQYAMKHYVMDVLRFKYKYVSIAVYFVLIVGIIIILYFTGILEELGITIIDSLSNTFNLSNLVLERGYYKSFTKLIGCSGPLFTTIIEGFYDFLFRY